MIHALYTPSNSIILRFEIQIVEDALIIPINAQNGRLVGNLALNRRTLTQGVRINSIKSCSKVLYNCNAIPLEVNNLVITLGIPAVWRLWEVVYPNVVGLLDPVLKKSQIEFITSVVKQDGALFVVTPHNCRFIRWGTIVAGELAKLRFTRHVTIPSESIVHASSTVLQHAFDHV